MEANTKGSSLIRMPIVFNIGYQVHQQMRKQMTYVVNDGKRVTLCLYALPSCIGESCMESQPQNAELKEL